MNTKLMHEIVLHPTKVYIASVSLFIGFVLINGVFIVSVFKLAFHQRISCRIVASNELNMVHSLTFT